MSNETKVDQFLDKAARGYSTAAAIASILAIVAVSFDFADFSVEFKRPAYLMAESGSVSKEELAAVPFTLHQGSVSSLIVPGHIIDSATDAQLYINNGPLNQSSLDILSPVARKIRTGPPWEYIVLHHSGSDGSTVEGIRDWHVRHKGWAAMGYHFVIDRDGTIHVGERWRLQWDGAHCKGSRNTDGIGVCLIGNFDDGPPPDAQVAAAAALVEFLQFIHDIADDDVIEHRECGQTRCPGAHFNRKDLIERIHNVPAVELVRER